jgi:hypothetical protein
MSERVLDIQGYLTQQGGALGQSVEFKYFEIKIPELVKRQKFPYLISFDILATVVVTASATISNVGKHASRRVRGVVNITGDGEYLSDSIFENLSVDAGMELAQTNIEMRSKKLFIKFTGTSLGYSFSCSANVRYIVTENIKENSLKNGFVQNINSIVESMAESSSSVVKHSDTTDRGDANSHPASAISNTPAGTIAATTVQAAINELDGDIVGLSDDITNFQNIIDASHEPTGFENRTTSVISYNAGSRIFTINNVGTCYYWIKGVRYTLTGPLTTIAHADTSGTYFCYFDASNVLTVTNSFWDLSENCPIAFALYDTYPVSAQGILCDERHGITMDWATHAHLHFSKGAFVRSGFVIDPNSYVLNSSAINDKKYRIDDGYFVDEDIVLYHDDAPIMAPLVANRRYALMYRQGTSGDWTWSANELFPLLWSPTVGDYDPYYNQFVPGAPGSWQLTKITTNNRWFNVFTCVTNSAVAEYKLVNIVGQVLHSSLAAAQEESILSLEWGDVPFQEITPIYQATWRRGPYGGIGNPNVRPESIQKIVGVSITLAGLLASNHPSLAGRDLPNQHPATAISYDNSAKIGDLFSVDVQNAIEELGERVGFGAEDGTITRDGDGNITTVVYDRYYGDVTITMGYDLNGNVSEIKKIYTNDTTTYTRTTTLTYDGDGNLTAWSTV